MSELRFLVSACLREDARALDAPETAPPDPSIESLVAALGAGRQAARDGLHGGIAKLLQRLRAVGSQRGRGDGQPQQQAAEQGETGVQVHRRGIL